MLFFKIFLNSLKRPTTDGLCLVHKKRISNKILVDLLKEMPKENNHTVLLRNQRVKMKEKGQKYSPGTVNLQVIGSGAKGAPRSLYLFTDQSRYLFNCGEGTQRLAHEHKMKLSKLEHIFVTHGCWENVGGLPGVALTIQDVGVPEITLHGPEGIDKIFSATKRFVVLRNLSIKTAECKLGKSYEDNAIQVKYVPIVIENKNLKASEIEQSTTTESSSEDEIDYYAHERQNVEQNKKQRNKQQSLSVTKENSEPSIDIRSSAMSYIVKLQHRPGTLCLEKCVEAGVPPGPLLGRLKNGEDIVLDDGTIVRSADVTSPIQPGPVFLVVDCPNIAFVEALNKQQAFIKYQIGGSSDPNDMPVAIAHFSPPDVMNHQSYRSWMSKFPLSTHHLILNTTNTCMGSLAVHRVQHKLHLLEPSIFPLLKDEVVIQKENTTNGTAIENGSKNLEFLSLNARTFSTVNLRPKILVDSSIKLTVNPEEYRNEVMTLEGFSTELAKLRTNLEDHNEKVEEVESNYPNFIFLGTGSCIPNKIRNTSAILLNISEEASILLDCGEGTYGQLVRHFGPSKVDEVLLKLKAIYISHLHADHHIGLVGLLKAIKKLNDPKTVRLLAPRQIMYWLNFYNKHFESILGNTSLIPNTDMLFDEYNLSEENQRWLRDDLNLERVETCYVEHCPNAFGISLKHRNGWKLTYSGDTMPSDSLVSLGAGSYVLIHEATMEDELEEEAKVKLHSTTSQAIEIGKRMKAGYTILTHFSQRYAKLPRLGDSNIPGENVGIAFDNMKVSFSDLPKLHLLYPALKLMFQEDCEELEVKALKRQMKQERENRKKQKLNETIPVNSNQTNCT